MLASLCALGYSFEAAIADIVDNSIAADASRIDVQFRTEPQPYVAVVDDGRGMAGEFLLEAMRHGGTGPESKRDARDLGRFGLGLKTASLSQCRRLTVVSLQSGILSAAAWDLDRVEEVGDWVLQVLDPEEAVALPHATELMARGRGTVVVWQGFDRATAGESSEAGALGELVDLAANHLSLVFHRFLVNDDGHPGLTMAVNNRRLEPRPGSTACASPPSRSVPEHTNGLTRATTELVVIAPPELARRLA
jgi:hypothetical protein